MKTFHRLNKHLPLKLANYRSHFHRDLICLSTQPKQKKTNLIASSFSAHLRCRLAFLRGPSEDVLNHGRNDCPLFRERASSVLFAGPASGLWIHPDRIIKRYPSGDARYWHTWLHLSGSSQKGNGLHGEMEKWRWWRVGQQLEKRDKRNVLRKWHLKDIRSALVVCRLSLVCH